MKSCLLAVLVLATSSAVAQANVGIFTGTGVTIQLTGSKQVQLVSEDVTIIPERGRFLFDGSGAGMDRVEYICKFELKNTSDREASFTAGFPLTSDSVERLKEKEADVASMVVQYQFMARDDGHTYHVRYHEEDADKKFGHLFVWDMKLAAGEKSQLLVTYSMPISMTLASTDKRESMAERVKRPAEKQWYDGFGGGLMEYFGYVTETGQSWAGPIERATFRVQVAGFEKYLQHRGLLDVYPDGATDEVFLGIRSHTAYREVSPEGWVLKGEWLQWEYAPYKPGKLIEVSYYLVPVPRTADDCAGVVKGLLGQEPKKEDLQDLREIVAAYYGLTPKTQRIVDFVKNQVWYHPAAKPEDVKLSEEQKAVLAKLDEIIKSK
jgi:hypothetical protein